GDLDRVRLVVQQQPGWRRYAAPAAFLLAVTVAVALVRSGLEHGRATPSTTTTARRIAPSPQVTTTPNKREYWRVRAGGTIGGISAKNGGPVPGIQSLDP